MKSNFILCLALVLGGIFPTVPANAQPHDLANADESPWGESVGGFQMSAVLDKTNGLLHCHIRNATTNTLTMAMSREDCQLQIQQTTNWTRLGAWPIPVYFFSGVSPRPERIKAKQSIVTTIPPSYLRPAHGVTNRSLEVEPFNEWLAERAANCREDTFAFDLIETDWPADVSGPPPVKIRVCQQFFLVNNSSESELTLYSGEIHLDGPVIRSLINQRDKAHTQ